jgi:hypothetical protein
MPATCKIILEEPSWEAHSYSAGPEFSCFYGNTRLVIVLSRDHQWILSWSSCIQFIFSSCFFQVHFNVSGPSVPRPLKWASSSRFSDLWFSHFPHMCYSHAGLILLDFVSLLIVGEKYKSRRYKLFNCIHPLSSLSVTDTNILLNILFWNTFNLC